MRALVGNDQAVAHRVLGVDDETLTNVDSNLAVTVTRADGTVLTGGNATSTGTGTYSFPLTAATHTSRLDTLALRFSGAVATKAYQRDDYVKVVGARFFTLADLRATRGLAGNASAYPNAVLAVSRDIAEDFIEAFCRDAFVPQVRRDTFDGDGCDELYLTRGGVTEIISVTIDGDVQDSTGWTVSSSGRVRTGGVNFTSSLVGQNVVVEYGIGGDPLPGDLRSAAIRLARHITVQTDSSIPDRARMMQTEFAMYQLDVADEEHPTGVPDIDSVLRRYRREQADWIVA